jgi:hypothetical protein
LLLGTCDYFLTFSLLVFLSYMLIFSSFMELGLYYNILSTYACVQSHTHSNDICQDG